MQILKIMNVDEVVEKMNKTMRNKNEDFFGIVDIYLNRFK